jgi:hypothetical protein
MEDISSREDDVSSKEAAFSEAPSANCWLADETWLEAEATCPAASPMDVAVIWRTRVIPLAMKKGQQHADDHGNAACYTYIEPRALGGLEHSLIGHNIAASFPADIFQHFLNCHQCGQCFL